MEDTAVKIGQMYQQADWKSEKHVPVIDCPGTVKSGEAFEVAIQVGKETPHPNTTEHFIQWIQLHFVPEDDKFAYDLGHFEFNAHAASVAGANEGPSLCEPMVKTLIRLKKSGTLIATEQCNIHGLWEYSFPITVS